MVVYNLRQAVPKIGLSGVDSDLLRL